MSINKFAIGLGIALVLFGLLVGADRFSVTSDGDTGTCSSYFSGPTGDIGDALAAEQKRQLDELGTGQRYHGSTTFADQCDSKRDQRGLFTWLLIGGGGVLVAGGALVRPAKREGAQPK